DYAERGAAVEERPKRFGPGQAVAHAEQKVAVLDERAGLGARPEGLWRDEDVFPPALVVLPALARRIPRHQIHGARPVGQAIDEGALAGAAGAVEQKQRAGARPGAQPVAPRQAFVLHGAPFGPWEHDR